MKLIKKCTAYFFAFIFSSLTTFTVNSACVLINHQEKESPKLKKLRKNI